MLLNQYCIYVNAPTWAHQNRKMPVRAIPPKRSRATIFGKQEKGRYQNQRPVLFESKLRLLYILILFITAANITAIAMTFI